MDAGWYQRGSGRERFHDGTKFTGQTRAPGEKTADGFDLFVWEDGAYLPGTYGSEAAHQYKEPGWRRRSSSRFNRVAMVLLVLIVASFFVWVAIRNSG